MTRKELRAIICEAIGNSSRVDPLLSAIEAAGVRLVPAQLNSKNLEHWKIASAGINAIEDYGGQFGCDHTPERQIADAYRDMVQIAASPYASPGG